MRTGRSGIVANRGADDARGVVLQRRRVRQRAARGRSARRYRASRVSATRFAAICAVRSPSRSSGVRTLASTSARMSSTDPPAPHEPHGRKNQSFLIDLARDRHRARTHAADVRVMRAIGDVERRPPVASEEHRRDERDVRQVRAAVERIVQHHDVAGLHLERRRSRRAPTTASRRDARACDRPARSSRPPRRTPRTSSRAAP